MPNDATKGRRRERPGGAEMGAASVVMTSPAPEAAERQGLRVLAILSALMGFASISTDFYLPALPTMVAALRSDAGTMEYSISGYLVGFSLGQLVWGPIGDRYGRRVPVAIGLVLFAVGSAGCALSGSAHGLIGWRMVQAVGACAGVVLSRAMVRDLYAGDRAAQMLSTLITVMAIAPLLGPVLGGQILALAGWRAIFWTLVGVGLLTLCALLTLPETLPSARRDRTPLSGALAGYVELLRDRRLLAYAGTGACLYAGTFAYIAASSFAYIAYHHVPPELYGLLFGVGIVGIMAANLINARLVIRHGSDRLMLWGSGVAAVSAVVLAATARTDAGGLAGLAVPLFAFVSSTGFIVANSIVGAMAGFPQRAGAVSALVGAIQYGSGIVGSALVGLFADGTPWPMGWVIGLCGLGCLACARMLPGRTPAGS